MQPPFQIRLISPRLIFQLYSSDPRRMTFIPCAYEHILLAYSASRTASMRSCLLPLYLAVGPGSCLLASTRSALRPESTRASSAACIVGIAMPNESAVSAVHFPVPSVLPHQEFCLPVR